jgi:hypothetical protein
MSAAFMTIPSRCKMFWTKRATMRANSMMVFDVGITFVTIIAVEFVFLICENKD